MRKSWKKTALILIISLLLLASYSVVYAGSITGALSSIVARVVVAFDRIGDGISGDSENEMADIAVKTKNIVDGIISKTQQDVEAELDAYKDAQLEKKNQEIDALVKDTEASVNRKKAEKLDEYKEKIDEKINREYDKLINDLTNGNS